MPIGRITGVNASINSEELVGVSPNIINGYSNELQAVVKRPGFGFQMDLGSSGISGFFDWEDAGQVIVTQYDGSIWRLDANGDTLLSSNSVKCGPLRPTFDGNGQKLWIASGGMMINITSTTAAGGAVYLPAYTTLLPMPTGITGEATTTITTAITVATTSIPIAASLDLPTAFPYDAVIFPYAYGALGQNSSFMQGNGEIVSVTGMTGLVLTVTRAISGLSVAKAFQPGDYLVGPVAMAIAAPPSNVSHVIYYDGYIICNSLGTGTAYINDGPELSDVDPNSDLWTLQRYINAEYKPDIITGIYTWYHEIFIFGLRTLELWYNDIYAPFAKIEGRQLDTGIISPNSVVNFSNTPYFMTNERKIVVYQGANVKHISGAIQSVLDKMSIANDVIASVISDNGQDFILWSFPSSGQTWAYNVVTGLWSKWLNPDQTANINIGSTCRIQDTSFNNSNNLSNFGWAGSVSTVSNATLTTIPWVNPSNITGSPNILVSGTSVATFTPSTGTLSDWLVSGTYGLDSGVPSGATITGLEAKIYFMNAKTLNTPNLGEYIMGDGSGEPPQENVVSAATVYFSDVEIHLTGNSNISGASAILAGNTSKKDALIYGGLNNTWGKILTKADVSTLGFKWRAKASASGSSILKAYAMSIKVYYSTSTLVAANGATWAGDLAIGRIYNVSSLNYSDELTSAAGVPIKSPIKITVETPPLGYSTLKRKMCRKLALQYRTKSHSVRLYINNDNKGYGPAIVLSANTGLWSRRNNGLFVNRQYKIEHQLDSAFSFISLEEDVSVLK